MTESTNRTKKALFHISFEALADLLVRCSNNIEPGTEIVRMQEDPQRNGFLVYVRHSSAYFKVEEGCCVPEIQLEIIPEKINEISDRRERDFLTGKRRKMIGRACTVLTEDFVKKEEHRPEDTDKCPEKPDYTDKDEYGSSLH